MNAAELVKAISTPPISPSVDEFLDLELVDRVGGHLVCSVNPFVSIPARVLLAMSPAERIAFNVPAAKPSMRNTIIPHGDQPVSRSISQPMNPPTMIPATNSLDNRNARPRFDGFSTRLPVSSSGSRGFGLRAPNRSPSRRSRASSAASSASRARRLFPSGGRLAAIVNPSHYGNSPPPSEPRAS